MIKNDYIRARIESGLKTETVQVLDSIGMNVTEAITLFFKQICMTQGIPFDVKIPNAKTKKAMDDARKGKNLVKCKDADDFFKKLKI